MSEFNPDTCKSRYELCTTKNGEIERRIGSVEQTLKDSTHRQEEQLDKIYTRFDKVADEMQRRLPGWATIIIGLLSAFCGGLGVAALK